MKKYLFTSLSMILSVSLLSQQEKTDAAGTFSASWNIIGGSRNVHGVTSSYARPLQYNAALNTVSFLHRCSNTYTAGPFDNSGAIVAEISGDWGLTWDSTCLFTDAAHHGRFPSGAIYNPSGNTNINNAYIVGSGPTNDLGGFSGCWFASKQLGPTNYNSTASPVPGAMQLQVGNTNTVLGRIQLSHYGFSSTTNGKVRTLGKLIPTNGMAFSEGSSFDGIKIATGSYNAGVFDWTGDSINFQSFIHYNTFQTAAINDDYYMVAGPELMAWNEAGTHGYIVVIGVRKTPLNPQSSGFQPLVWRTSNGGLTWLSMPGIDFSSPVFSHILKHISAVNNNTALTIPNFNTIEGIGITVDINNKLHLAATVYGASKSHPDSVSSFNTYTLSTNTPTMTYVWKHTPGYRPYIYDFMLDGSTSTWNYKLIDSLSTEAPGGFPYMGGFPENPFDDEGNGKVVSSARIQLSRTADGSFIVYSWAESDTNFTSGISKYNEAPNIKLRLMDVNGMAGSGTYKISITEINASNLGSNPDVTKKALLHFISPVSGPVNSPGTNINLTVPLTVTHSKGFGSPGKFMQSFSNTHWYSSVSATFSRLMVADPIGIEENSNANNSFSLYPNPGSENVNIILNSEIDKNASLEIYNSIGQLVKTFPLHAKAKNTSIHTQDLSAGIYLISMKSGNTCCTKKLIIE